MELSCGLISFLFCLYLAFVFLLQNLSSVKMVNKGEISLKYLRLPEHKSFSLALKFRIWLVGMSCLESQIVLVLQVSISWGGFRLDDQGPLLFSRIVLSA